MELRKLLEDSGIRKAIVIDDVFDDVPRPDELDEGDWSNFFDDLGEGAHKLLADQYPEYEEASRDDLRVSQKFIAIVWENRTKLLQEVCDHLFRNYENTKTTERTRLDQLVTVLESLDLTCTKMGREFDEEAKEAELLFVDLFLGFHQSEDDMNHSIQRVGKLVSGRKQNPPLVVLMSRSSRLQEHRDKFRDEAGLLGSTFRVVSKADLASEGTLETILTRLAMHYQDAKRVAGFVHAWDTGLDQARKNFIQVLRRLDLSDLGQVRALLLESETQKLGEYLLDVADGALQHEIEGDSNTIGAALELNKIDLSKYPAPHLVGSPDLQDLVHRMTFLHSDRLRLSKEEDKVQLQFGDLLRWKSADGAAFSDDVSLVVTPACDLVRNRNGVERVMLLSGKLRDLEPKDWSYKRDPVRTPIVILPDEDRKWIEWDLKDVKALSWSELDDLFDAQKRLSRIGRFREIHAIEIQQMLLTYLGRIGRPANLPVSFPVNVSFFYIGTDSKVQKLDVEEIESAACYVGRDAGSEPVHRLVLTEQACDHIERALRAIDDNKLHRSARASLTAVKDDRGFFTQFERGEIEIPSGKKKKSKKFIQSADARKPYAAIVRSDDFDLDDGRDVPSDLRKVAVIIKVTDVLEEGTD